ncbi:YaiO family outer membrane beta-barrel protein [Christiangramia forsetii]|uniref:Secreted protein containing tetratricopeptide repeats n=1 Tax=Christiangramia forsetii (strain DSM 17595 / CGMCC 1.15422 / KT0803) TaxID=411154 RepID=A0LZL5_CHRFK|nr:YaiO family outer membrane beta-barrel protein [Christiangramia forsetii]CAL65810.1 secreted protein containing tetratricopeptide repeats [Christiangramia forsetii KT0803]
MRLKITFPLLLIFLTLFSSVSVNAQEEEFTTDELFVKARTAAFDEDNYPKAIELTLQALDKSSSYADVRIFLGRLYTWTDKVDSARVAFERVLEENPGHQDGSLAYANLEYWNDNSEKALKIVNNGIEKNPKAEDLLLLKAKILKDLEQYSEATNTLNKLLRINPKLPEARSLGESIRNVSARNQIGVDYEFVNFENRFDDPWHLASVDYSRSTKIGSIIGRLNYANRFASNGTQIVVDAYPSISDTFYAYLSGGISSSGSIFPEYRVGASLYANLPASFEGEVGFRMLSFDEQTWIYTASVGKYISNFWLNARTYLTPGDDNVSHSYSLNVRYYIAGADDYLSFGVGTGISPDDNTNNILIQDPYKLKSSNISVGYRMSVNSTNVFFINAELEDQEYAPETRGNQFSIGIGYFKKF